MANQSRTTKPDGDKKSGVQNKPQPVSPEQTNEPSPLADVPGGLLGAAGDPSIEEQAARLNNANFQTVQRQAMAAQLGRVGGNQYLQRVLQRQTAGEESPPQSIQRQDGEHEQGRQEPLRLVARDGVWLVFNRPAFRPEVVQYIWGGTFNPTQNELHPSPAYWAGDLVIGDTHWALAQTDFAARPGLYRQIRPNVRQQIESLQDRAETRPPHRPEWIPQDIWRQFLQAEDGVHRYSGRSPLGTDIILIKRNNSPFGGYAEGPTDEAVLFRQMGETPPSLIRRLLGAERPSQARIRWLAEVNQGYNQFMWRQVQSGVGPRQARQNYRDAVYQAYLRAHIPLIGFIVTAAHPAGETVGGMLRAGQHNSGND